MKPVYFNHDGGVDDLVSVLLLTQMETVHLLGISVIPADSYLEPAVSATEKIVNVFGKEPVEVAASTSRGVNPFPSEWRLHPYYVDALPVLNETDDQPSLVVDEPAHKHMIRKIHEASEPVTLVFTGPLTDLARALDRDPTIEDKIERLYWMGGTFKEKGNVQEPHHDSTAEWNAFWDPVSTDRVWKSSLDILLVSLESTDELPLTNARRKEWAKLRNHEKIDFLGQCYASVPPLVFSETNSTYYLWDVFTAAMAGKPSFATEKEVTCIVHTEGASQGRIEKSPTARSVHYVDSVDADAFFRYMIELLK
ncbi:nucleoside hydrolase [Shouchella shacheensis]|uniref:nucleoside hydrolase n=1 Tax=Shouchella shacheensis TaxID=1649580 RepID=UPI0007401A15|nr:nucleoside hydrolase [Shouchella shacheensis]